jgi:hypothetical protein
MRSMRHAAWVVAATAGCAAPAMAEYEVDLGGGKLSVTGYVREYLGLNLENKPDIMSNGKRLNGKWDLNMARSTMLLDTRADFGRARLTAIGRWTREVETNYLDRLNDSSSKDLIAELDENDLREIYLDLDVSKRLSLRLGRQQVAWGETDSFQVLDVVNGFDFNWRSSFEAENEELRKPLIMANAVIDVPELAGSLQLLYRPGWDAASDVGYTLPFTGNRFAPQGSLGKNALDVIPYNYDHSRGDTDRPSYGGRWMGEFKQVGYSLNYYHTVFGIPVINFADLGFPGYRPWGEVPRNGFAEFVLPEVDIFGGTFNSYSEKVDAVFRGELAYIPNKPYNHGFSGTPLGGALNIIKKDTATWMLGVDKDLKWTSELLGTSQPGAITGQLIDTWVVNFDKHDDLLESGVTPRREHSVVTTWIFGLNFRHNTWNPSLGLLYDVTYGGGAVIAALNNVIGDHWRIYTEYVGFFKNGQTCSIDPVTKKGLDCQHGFGNFDNKDQLTLRVTYQF